MFQHILVPTDGSNVAERAGELAISIVDQYDADLSVISVVHPRERERGDRSIDRIRDQAASIGIDAHTQTIESRKSPAGEILDFAAANAIDVIVMGTHGRTGLNRFILGSVALQTLQESKIPVITVHEDSELGFEPEHILIPSDGSRSAKAAAKFAIDLASDIGATVHAMHVTNESAEHSENANTPAHEVAELARASGVDDVEVVVRRGRPHLEIAGYISEVPCDLVVMGAHGHTGLRRYLLGSVTERTIRFSTVPVVTIRHHQVLATVEYLNYDVLGREGWSIDDQDLFEKAANANLDSIDFGTIDVDEGEYILDAAESEGHDWPFHCRAGSCVNCAGLLIEGDVEMERCRSLSDEERDENNLFLTCVAIPSSTGVQIIYNAKELDIFANRIM